MPYKTVRTEKRTSTGTRTVFEKVWYDVPKRNTVSSLLGTGSFVKNIANEPLQYEYRGKVYQDIPSEMIDRIDEALWDGDVEFANRAFSMVEQARKKAEEMRIADNSKEQKGENIMKHNNFKSIFTELKEIYADTHAACTDIFGEWEEAQKEWKNTQANYTFDAKGKLLAESDYIRAEEKFKKAHAEITETTQQRVADLKKVLEEAANVHYRIKPDKVDNATLELLRLGVLKDSDITQLVKDNIGNPTMLTVIKKYAGERNTAEMRVLVQDISRITDEKKEIGAFDTLCKYGARSYDLDSVKRHTFEQMLDGIFNDVIASASDVDFDRASNE